MNIAFCINRLGLSGLGGTVSSLIRNCSKPEKLTLWFICAGFESNDKKKLIKLLKDEGVRGKYHFKNFDPQHFFGSFPSLHGDWTPYGRLLLADIIDEDRVLYLDSDLVVEVHVLDLANYTFEGHIIAAVGGGRFKYSLGSKFYIETIGLPPDAEYFNSGVLLLNLKGWRENKILEECMKIARRYSKDLPSHDESLLNIICAGNFAKLPASFNCGWEAVQSKPDIADKMILHFIGSPKPWDPFGSLLHNGYRDWLKYNSSDWISLRELTLAELVRVWHIRRSYMRCILKKMRK